jgi:protein phosphatase
MGLVRTNNEDHYAVVRRYRSREVLLTNLPPDAYPPHEDSVYAFAVADGIGGAAFGELASELALRTGWELTGKAFKWGFVLSEEESQEMLESVNVYVQLIHQRIQSEGQKMAYRGMGTTLTGVLTVGREAFVVNVGDSRAYLFRHGQLLRLTHDQTLAELMVKSGMIASVDDAAQRFRNTLVSCLGGKYTEVDVESLHLSLENGDQLLLCTDGLTDMVSEARIAEIIGQPKSAQEACDDLIQAALGGGGKDNVTAVLGRYIDFMV